MPVLRHETYVVDKQTGEYTATVKSINKNVDQDNFYMTYVDNMSGFFKLKSAIDIKVLAKLCQHAQYNTNEVHLPSPLRAEIESELDISTQQFSNALKALKKNSLISGEKGLYKLNPLVYWKGRNDHRTSLLLKGGVFKVMIEFGINVETYVEDGWKITKFQ